REPTGFLRMAARADFSDSAGREGRACEDALASPPDSRTETSASRFPFCRENAVVGDDGHLGHLALGAGDEAGARAGLLLEVEPIVAVGDQLDRGAAGLLEGQDMALQPDRRRLPGQLVFGLEALEVVGVGELLVGPPGEDD